MSTQSGGVTRALPGTPTLRHVNTPRPGTRPSPHPTEIETLDGSRMTRATQRRRAFAWQLRDVGASAYDAVIVTFVFATYLASDYFLDPAAVALGQANPEDPTYIAAQAGSAGLISGLNTAAAVVVALLAPALGRSTDGTGRRKLMLGVLSGVVMLVMLGMFTVLPHAGFLLWGAILLAVGTVFSELANVNYFAMLNQVATRDNVGRVSGTGWGLGYIGSIVLLLGVLVALILGGDGQHAGLLGVPAGQDNGALNIRIALIVAAIWFAGFTLPILLRVPEAPKDENRSRTSIFAAYRQLAGTIALLCRTDRPLLRFLVSSAIFRDGLGAVFAYGAVLGVQVYGFSTTGIMLFAVAANLVAGVGTLAAGWFDDRFSAKHVIVFSLVSLIVAGVVLMATPNDAIWFWIIALILCLFVGPVQSSSRAYLARATPPQHEGEVFGLYATTARAAGWLSNGAFFLFVLMFSQTKAGVWGILLIFAVGLLLFLPVPAKPKVAVLR